MQTKRQRKHRSAPHIGGVFVLLAVIGVVTVIVASLQLTGKVLDNSGEKDRLAKVIQPVIMFDPVPFDSPANVPMENLVLYSMWGALISDRAKNYTFNENQELTVPASDLDVACTNLFGSDVKLEHQTVRDYDNAYLYSDKTKTYSIRVSAQLYVYSPDVREITKEGDLYCLDVYYVPPSNAWNMSPAGDKMSPYSEKHMFYYMKKEGSQYHLVKIQDPPPDGTQDLIEQSQSAGQSQSSSSQGAAQ